MLRGFVLTPEYVDPYTAADYTRIKSFGGNFQSIEVPAGAAGYPDPPNTAGLDLLGHMVQLAEQQGMYTDFKMTIYDVHNWDWTSFWKDGNGEQEEYLKIWSAIWQRFENDPGVVGYDLLNEPSQGRLGLSYDQFESQYLTPFYEKAIAELRESDTRHIAFFQTELDGGYKPYPHPPSGLAETAYDGHLYGKSQSGVLALFTRYRQEAATAGVPLVIWEYGQEWVIANDGNAALEAQAEELESTMLTLINQYGLSYSRAWYFDDKRFVHRPDGQSYTWSIFPGKSGRNGSYRTWIIDPFMTAAGVSKPPAPQ